MDTTDNLTTYFTDYLPRVTRIMNFNLPRLPIQHLNWLQWGVSILHNVLSFIEHYKLQDYTVEDKNRVSLVAWECALTMLLKILDFYPPLYNLEACEKSPHCPPVQYIRVECTVAKKG